MSKTFWDKTYENTPLDDIPWQKTQDDWLKELLIDGTIQGKTAIDLGCGTGKKSIQLAEAGFDSVLGIDIAERAIKYANENLATTDYKDKVAFACRDATDLSFLGDETFDFVLDWANLHGLPSDLHAKYANEIAQHTSKGSMLLLRAFKKPEDNDIDHFTASSGSAQSEITLISEQMVSELLGEWFEIAQTNTSKPRTEARFEFGEYLMKRK